MPTKRISFFFAAVFSCLVLSAQTPTPTAPSVQEQRLSIDYPDSEIRTVLRDLADQYELNVIIPESLRGKTSLKLRDVTWKQAFKVILTPVGYTYIEDGQIVKIIPLEDTLESKDKGSNHDCEWALFESPWYVAVAVCLVVLTIVGCHLVLFVGVLRDATPNGTRFAPKLIWAFFVLVGGILPLVGYWLIHHSSLAKEK